MPEVIEGSPPLAGRAAPGSQPGRREEGGEGGRERARPAATASHPELRGDAPGQRASSPGAEALRLQASFLLTPGEICRPASAPGATRPGGPRRGAERSGGAGAARPRPGAAASCGSEGGRGRERGREGAPRRGRGLPGSSAGVGWGVEAGRKEGKKEKKQESERARSRRETRRLKRSKSPGLASPAPPSLSSFPSPEVRQPPRGAEFARQGASAARLLPCARRSARVAPRAAPLRARRFSVGPLLGCWGGSRSRSRSRRRWRGGRQNRTAGE